MINRCKHNPCCGDQTYCSRPIGLSAELAQARAEGERAGRIAGKIEMREMAAQTAEERLDDLSDVTQPPKWRTATQISHAIRCLKVEGEIE